MEKSLKSFIGLVLCLFITALCCFTVGFSKLNADAEETRDTGGETITVRVGYYNDPNERFQVGANDEERKSGYAYEYYQQISSVADWVYVYVYCHNISDALNKLTAGEVDIVAGVNINASAYNGRTMLHSQKDMGLPDKLYFVVSAKNMEIYNDLNMAMQFIDENLPAYTVELYQKYYGATVDQILTQDDIEWLENKHEIKVGFIKDNLPISDVNGKGEPIGLVKELSDKLDSYIPEDVKISFVGFDTVDETEEALKTRAVDVIFPMYYDYWLSETKGFKHTDPVFSDRIMIIFCSDDDRPMYTLLLNIASSPRAVGQRMYIQNLYPDINSTIRYTETIDDALQTLKDKKADCVLGCSSVMQRYWNSSEKHDGLTATMLSETAEFSFAVHESDTVLVGILNKFVRQLPHAEVTNALMRYSVVEKGYTFGDFIRGNIIAVVAVLLTFIIILGLVFFFYIRRTRAFNAAELKSHKALQEALEMAKNASEAKTTFLSSMSHDIRTPMNAIVGMTSIATKYINDKERVKDCLNKITLSSNHLLTLINDVLDISKIESGKLVLNPIAFSLREALTNLVNIVRPMVTEKRLQFDIHIQDVKHEYVFADCVRINQIFINILSNAVKYTPEGGKVILSLKEEQLESSDKIRLIYSVKDNGIGMSEEYMKVMYDPFSRAGDTRTNTVQGTGLGLAIVKQMVGLMGGKIECNSKINEGTEFEITLDVPAAAEAVEKQPLPKIKILVADDDEIFLESVTDTLTDMGLLVDAVNSGETAIKKAEENKDFYKVAVIDWKMPGIGGLETIKRIRKIVGKDTPIILVSAYDWEDIEEEAKQCGADGFISKPLFRSYIYEKLCEVLHLNGGDSHTKTDKDIDLHGIKILVAEDNELNWEVISTLLDSYKISTERAENGKICVDKLNASEAGKYDLVLMDVQMPVMDGKEAARQIRKSEKEHVRNIPVLAMTADAFAEDVEACLNAGMNGHLSKPVDMDKLCHEIRKHVFKNDK